MPAPLIEIEKCTGCGLCVGVCQDNRLHMVNNMVVFVKGSTCSWCGLCEAVCCTGAIGCPFEIILDEP